LLLEQVIPGQPLSLIASQNVPRAIQLYSQVADSLYYKAKTSSIQGFESIQKWFLVFDRLDVDALPNKLILKARVLAEKLLANSNSQVVLHGDLHFDNVLSHQTVGVAIDPKGIVGPKEFELAAFALPVSSQFMTKKSFSLSLSRLATLAKVDEQIVLDWMFVRLVLAACWEVEDNGDPTRFVKQIPLIQG
jgi:streptomycin 6-kinase